MIFTSLPGLMAQNSRIHIWITFLRCRRAAHPHLRQRAPDRAGAGPDTGEPALSPLTGPTPTSLGVWPAVRHRARTAGALPRDGRDPRSCCPTTSGWALMATRDLP